MLTAQERSLLASIDFSALERHLDSITAYDRLSGSDGEARAVEYIATQLEGEGLPVKIHHYPVLLSNPHSCSLEYETTNGWCAMPAKTRSFSASSKPITGELVYIPAAGLPADILSYQLQEKSITQDLSGKIVLSETTNPVAVLACARRGALGYIQYWSSDESLIHEGIFNPVWGTPLPGEQYLHPRIPVAAITGPAGATLKAAASDGVKVRFTANLTEAVTRIPVLEAVIAPPTDNPEYLLIGNHLDSWYEGVTDNGTGNAMALCLARLLHSRRHELRYGVRLLWWSGHSNGRYAGSSSYACDEFPSLLTECLAYMNIDMPGIRGATDYTKLTAGQELFPLAAGVLKTVTNQAGIFTGPIRGWDQSFQNIGISPYFIWASAFPSGHPDTTGGSLMPWWWHTEADTRQYYDPAVLRKDTELYLLAAWRLLTVESNPFDLGRLFTFIVDRLDTLKTGTCIDANLSRPCDLLKAAAVHYNQSQASLPLRNTLRLLRKLNQFLYVEKSPELQDWALEQGYFPGFRRVDLLQRGKLSDKQDLMLRHYLACQTNRLTTIAEDICSLLSH